MSVCAFSRVGVLANHLAVGCLEAEAKLRERLEKSGLEVVEITPPSCSEVDVLVLLGGDGFLMETVLELDYPSLPVFGVNFGTVGFHMNPQSSLDDLPDLLAEGRHREDKHPVLEVVARLEDGSEQTVYAFNDVLLERQTRQSVRLRVHLDGMPLNRFAGDGFVVATAAGSTAYNLAAGGPAVHPELEAMVVTPLYPHQAVPFSSVQFSLAVPLSSELRFEVDDLPKRRMRLVADGRPLEFVASAEIKDSGRRICLLRDPSRGIAETLSKKIIGE